METDHSGPWYHGSPLRLKLLRRGSVVTPFKELAKAFAHKPTRTSAFDDYRTVKHNGKLPGFLYILSESMAPGDISEMLGTDATHWVIQRDIEVELLAKLPVSDPPLLTEEEIAHLRKDMPDGDTGFVTR